MNPINPVISLASETQTDRQRVPRQPDNSWNAAGRHCPECGAIIYCRRHRLCGVCGEPLPEIFLFSKVEASRLERILAAERARHRSWMARVSEKL
jgi:predicted nucleic acid-binding Zn ribbon protein